MKKSRNIKYYFKAKLVCDSPLHIGNGLEDNSDGDILLDTDNKPTIPGTTLAGILRHYLKKCNVDIDVVELFGDMYGSSNSSKTKRSNITIYDAEAEEKDNCVIAIRDNVRIGDDGVAMDAKKFDYEILEPGASFKFRAELTVGSEGEAIRLFTQIIKGFNRGDLRIGSKTTRGFGKMTVSEPKYYLIDLKKNIDDYINFSWNNVNQVFEPLEEDEQSNQGLYETIKLDFVINTFLFIRNYSCTTQDEYNDNKLVDAEQITYTNGEVVIPGTSWAGVFRHHFERILREVNQKNDLIKKVFGDVEEEKEKREKRRSKSKIFFSETVVSKDNMHNRTRNAVDRFTGSAGDGLLFTTRPNYEGEGTLEIKIPQNLEEKDLVKSLIDVCIQDFNDGFLNIGGEGSTGGGLISMTKEGDWQ